MYISLKCTCLCLLFVRKLVFRNPGSGLQCVELHGQVSGGGIGLHSVNIRYSNTQKLICCVEGEAYKPDARFPFLSISLILSFILGKTCQINEQLRDGRT